MSQKPDATSDARLKVHMAFKEKSHLIICTQQLLSVLFRFYTLACWRLGMEARDALKKEGLSEAPLNR